MGSCIACISCLIEGDCQHSKELALVERNFALYTVIKSLKV